MKRTSDRIEGFEQSDIRRMSVECARVDGINLGQGICDIPTEELVADGAVDAIRENRATYSRLDGIGPLREAIARKASGFNGIDADPESEIIVTVGATGGFTAATMATLNPGDEVILFEPFYGYHQNPLKLIGVDVRYVELRAPYWRFDENDLRTAFTDKTRAIVVCTPSNPTGKVFTREELDLIGTLAAEHDCWIFTDEIYEYIVYEGNRHVSIGSIDEFRDRTITISGFSKTFSITGWRIGYVIAPRDVADAIGLVNDMFYVCAPTPLQWGVAQGLTIDDSYYRNLAKDYQQKRDLLAEALRDVGIKPFVPQGSYYMLSDIDSLGFDTSRDAADALLREVGVAAVPGSAFYRSGRDPFSLRFCFAKEFGELEQACERIRQFGSNRN